MALKWKRLGKRKCGLNSVAIDSTVDFGNWNSRPKVSKRWHWREDIWAGWAERWREAKRKGNQLWRSFHIQTISLYAWARAWEGGGRKWRLLQSVRPYQIQLFSDAFSSAKERLAYIAEMKDKLGESEWFKISSKRSVNPDSRTVFNMHTLFCKGSCQSMAWMPI